MSGKFRWLVTLIFASVLSFGAQASAQMKPGMGKEKEAEEKVKTGVIASFGNYQHQASVDSADSTAAAGDEPNPIGGSVNRISASHCQAVIKNMSKKNRYAVRAKVEGTTPSGAKISGKSISATVDPQSSVTRKMRCKKGVNMRIVLRSARKM